MTDQAIDNGLPPDTKRRALLRNRNFMLLWGAQTAGEVGSQITSIAIPLLALGVLDASVFEVSLLTALAWFPYLVFSLPAGILVDRFDPRRLMIGCDVGRLSLLAVIPIAFQLDVLSINLLGALAFLSGLLTVLFNVCYQTYLPRVVPEDQLVDGNGKIALSTEVAELVGPSTSGLLVSLVGAARTFLASGLAYLLSAAALLMMRGSAPRPAEDEDEDDAPLRVQIMGGLKFIRHHRILRSILATDTTSNFWVMAAGALEVTFLVRELNLSPKAVGLVFTISALGGITAGLLAGRLSAWIGDARIIWVAMLVPGPLYFLMPLSQPGWFGLVTFGLGLAAFSANVVLYNTAATSFQQRITPERLLGRVNAASMWISLGVVPIGALTGGWLGTQFGLRTALLICVIGTWSAALWVFFSPLRRMRHASEAMAPETA